MNTSIVTLIIITYYHQLELEFKHKHSIELASAFEQTIYSRKWTIYIMQTPNICIDLSKTFDHDILLHKLDYYGLSNDANLVLNS